MIMLNKNINKILTTLYNALGNKQIKELTGFNFDYKYDVKVIVNTDIIKTDNPHFEIYNFIIEINTDKPIPQFLPMTEMTRVSNSLPEGSTIYIGVISNNFIKLLKYINIENEFGCSIKVCFNNTMDYLSFITLESVNLVYDKNKGVFYRMNNDGSPDIDNQLDIVYNNIKDELTDVDKWKLRKYFN